MSTKYVASMLLFAILGFVPVLAGYGKYNYVEPLNKDYAYSLIGDALLSQNVLNITKYGQFRPKVYNVWVTGYSSAVEETDDTPFITASGVYVYEGIAAANFLPMGTTIRIPELFADQVFVIEDRMHPKNSHKVDIWFPSKQEAQEFGIKLTKIEVL